MLPPIGEKGAPPASRTMYEPSQRCNRVRAPGMIERYERAACLVPADAARRETDAMHRFPGIGYRAGRVVEPSGLVRVTGPGLSRQPT